jgi:hypothetical protein
MKLSRFLLLLSIMLVASCASRIKKLPLLTPEALNSDPAAHHQHTVLVEGFVTLTSSGHNLYQSGALKEEFIRNFHQLDSFDPRHYLPYCLTIANPQIFDGHEGGFSGRTFVFRGKFLKKYLTDASIDLGACPLPTAIVIDESDTRRRYPTLFGRPEK